MNCISLWIRYIYEDYYYHKMCGSCIAIPVLRTYTYDVELDIKKREMHKCIINKLSLSRITLIIRVYVAPMFLIIEHRAHKTLKTSCLVSLPNFWPQCELVDPSINIFHVSQIYIQHKHIGCIYMNYIASTVMYLFHIFSIYMLHIRHSQGHTRTTYTSRMSSGFAVYGLHPRSQFDVFIIHCTRETLVVLTYGACAGFLLSLSSPIHTLFMICVCCPLCE